MGNLRTLFYVIMFKKNLDAALLKQPNALIILTGDFNPTSTGFNQKYITVLHLTVMQYYNTIWLSAGPVCSIL
jgi:hypothetical protein